jgi:dienelactone hydrolase
VIAAYDYLAAIGAVDRERIGVCGASYGAYLAALLTAHRGIARLALRAPSLARDNDFPSMRETKSSKGKVPRGFDSVEVLRHYAGEVLILESEKDEIIPKSYISTYLGCCQRVSHQIIPGATHALTNPKWDEVFVSAITRWFERL